MSNPTNDTDENATLDAMSDDELDAYDAGCADDEPADIDGDDGFDPYAGGPESPYEADDAGDWYGDE